MNSENNKRFNELNLLEEKKTTILKLTLILDKVFILLEDFRLNLNEFQTNCKCIENFNTKLKFSELDIECKSVIDEYNANKEQIDEELDQNNDSRERTVSQTAGNYRKCNYRTGVERNCKRTNDSVRQKFLPKRGSIDLIFCSFENCDYESFSRHDMRKHVNYMHLNKSQLSCTQCRYTCWGKLRLNNHIRVIHRNDFLTQRSGLTDELAIRQYENYISKTTEASALNTEAAGDCETNFKERIEFSCTDCSFTCDSVLALNTHKSVIHKGLTKLNCSFDNCDYKSNNNHNMRRHLLRVHSSNMLINCKECEAKCMSFDQLCHHLKATHNNSFNNSNSLVKCSHCEHQFWGNSRLRRHIDLVHIKSYLIKRNNLKYFECYYPLCLFKARGSRYTVVRHIKSVHFGQLDKKCDQLTPNKFKCNVCHKMFETIKQLRIHFGVNHKKHYYKCGFKDCGYITKHLTKLSVHKFNSSHIQSDSVVGKAPDGQCLDSAVNPDLVEKIVENSEQSKRRIESTVDNQNMISEQIFDFCSDQVLSNVREDNIDELIKPNLSNTNPNKTGVNDKFDTTLKPIDTSNLTNSVLLVFVQPSSSPKSDQTNDNFVFGSNLVNQLRQQNSSKDSNVLNGNSSESQTKTTNVDTNVDNLNQNISITSNGEDIAKTVFKPIVTSGEDECVIRAVQHYSEWFITGLNRNRKVYKCNYCKFKTQYKKCINYHIKQIHNILPPIQTQNEQDKLQTDRLCQFKCQFCEYVNESEAKLARHRQQKHQAKLGLPRCPHCFDYFDSIEALDRHMDSLDMDLKVYICDRIDCQFECSDSDLFEEHKRKHLTENIDKCVNDSQIQMNEIAVKCELIESENNDDMSVGHNSGLNVITSNEIVLQNDNNFRQIPTESPEIEPNFNVMKTDDQMNKSESAYMYRSLCSVRDVDMTDITDQMPTNESVVNNEDNNSIKSKSSHQNNELIDKNINNINSNTNSDNENQMQKLIEMNEKVNRKSLPSRRQTHYCFDCKCETFNIIHHLRTVSHIQKTQLKCPKCDTYWPDSELLSVHNKSFHNIEIESKLLKCDSSLCSFECTDWELFNEHKSKHLTENIDKIINEFQDGIQRTEIKCEFDDENSVFVNTEAFLEQKFDLNSELTQSFDQKTDDLFGIANDEQVFGSNEPKLRANSSDYEPKSSDSFVFGNNLLAKRRLRGLNSPREPIRLAADSKKKISELFKK